MKMRVPAVVPGACATLLGVVAVAGIILGDDARSLWLGLIVHAGAVALALVAGRRRHGASLSQVESDAIVICAAAIPLFGPALAWTLPRSDRETRVENAHEVLERYSEHVAPRVPEWERTLFTGDHDRDLAREIDAETYVEVLRHGDTTQKRNALHGLAQLGGPHHLALIRVCLEDPDGEVRLYAYGELERLTRRHELRVREARRQVRERPDDPHAHVAFARAHLALGASGVLDPATAAFHFRGAARSAERAREIDGSLFQGVVTEALAHTRLGDLERAEQCLCALPPMQEEHPDACCARADIAYARRDFVGARREAERLRGQDAEVPDWLAALAPDDLFRRAPRGAAVPEEAPA